MHSNSADLAYGEPVNSMASEARSEPAGRSTVHGLWMPADHVQAYHDLIREGLHAVLCTHDKSPIWEGWNSKIPTFDQVIHHDSLIGHIPSAIRSVVFDVDGGSDEAIEAWCRRYPPLVRMPSAQPVRCHLYYLSGTKVRNGKFAGHGVSGDVRGEDGYVILWGDAAVRLRDALRNRDAPAAVPPLHLIIPNQPVSCDGSVTGAASDTRAVDTAPADSSPNPDLFDQLRHWAYRTPRGLDRTDWDRRVLDQAKRLNRAMSAPLPAKRVESVAASVAGWVWTNLRKEYRPGMPSGSSARARQGGSRAPSNRRPRRTTPPRPKPWLDQGIKPECFRQRLRRARAGTYWGAKKGVLPWEYLEITEELWRTYYALEPPDRTSDDPSQNCHGFATEPLIAGGGGSEGAGQQGPASGEVPELWDPVRSAVALMEAVATYEDPRPSPIATMTKNQFAQSGKEFRSATRSLTRFMNRMVNKKRKELVKMAEGSGCAGVPAESRSRSQDRAGPAGGPCF